FVRHQLVHRLRPFFAIRLLKHQTITRQQLEPRRRDRVLKRLIPRGVAGEVTIAAEPGDALVAPLYQMENELFERLWFIAQHGVAQAGEARGHDDDPALVSTELLEEGPLHLTKDDDALE